MPPKKKGKTPSIIPQGAVRGPAPEGQKKDMVVAATELLKESGYKKIRVVGPGNGEQVILSAATGNGGKPERIVLKRSDYHSAKKPNEYLSDTLGLT